MKNTHIAFVSFPHPPHVNPTLPIVSVLVRRGYRVSYATSDVFAARVSELGATVVPFPRFILGALSDEKADAEEGHEESFIHFIAQTVSEITRGFEGDRPDLIIYDFMAFAGRILAHRWNIPAIQTSPSFAMDEDNFSQQVKDPEFRQQLLQGCESVGKILEPYGVTGSSFRFDKEKLNIYLFPKALQPKGDVFGQNCFYAGRCAGEQLIYGDWRKKSTVDRPIAFVATSTTYVRGPEFFRTCIEALAGLQWHVILSIGDSGDAGSLMPLPPHFEIVQHNSHIQILRHASLFICLGGIITTSEAAYHGVPLIVTTHGFPELEWQADNIESLGLGVHLMKSETTVESIRKSAIHVSQDTAIHNRVRQMQRAVRREPGAEETANRIEEYLEAHTPGLIS